MSSTDNAKRAGQGCARCGMKAGAHDYPNPHPRACREWTTQAWLAEDIARMDENVWHDSDMEARG